MGSAHLRRTWLSGQPCLTGPLPAAGPAAAAAAVAAALAACAVRASAAACRACCRVALRCALSCRCACLTSCGAASHKASNRQAENPTQLSGQVRPPRGTSTLLLEAACQRGRQLHAASHPGSSDTSGRCPTRSKLSWKPNCWQHHMSCRAPATYRSSRLLPQALMQQPASQSLHTMRALRQCTVCS